LAFGQRNFIYNLRARGSSESRGLHGFRPSTDMRTQRLASKRHTGLLAMTAIILLSCARLMAQQAAITRIAIEKKPGSADGEAIATVKATVIVKGKRSITNKSGRIATHAVQAWTIMSGQGALLLLSPQKKGQQYRIHYYELHSGKWRSLGQVPFAQATLAEAEVGSAPWAFAIEGIDPGTRVSLKQPVIFAGDQEMIHAELKNASAPRFSGNSLFFQSSGHEQQLKISDLLGREAVAHIYAVPDTLSTGGSPPAYLQFRSNGESITVTAAGEVQRSHWLTDGSRFFILPTKVPGSSWDLADLKSVMGIPAGSRLNVRLLEPLSSRTTKKGMPVTAALISPGVFDGAILLPQGSEFDGTIVDAHGVNWGIRHETAALTLHFDSVKLPDGSKLPIDAQVFQVENSRENVTTRGTIQGVRSTGTIGHSAENQIASLTQIDPMGYLFASASGPAVLGFAEPEILFNAGTELDIEFNKPVITATQYAPRVPRMNLSGAAVDRFDALVRDLPFRTQTEATRTPSDITNLIFLGQPSALRHALEAAGWVSSDTLDAAAAFETVKTISGNQNYTQAPMSILILGNEKPLFTMEKSTDTFSSRHHLRVFGTGKTFDGESVLTASSTQDIGIAFSAKQKTFIHVIDPYIDNERSKVTNDLGFTGCVDAMDLAPRPWVPLDAYNSTGDHLITDGDAAILKLNDCTNPYTTPATVAQRAPLFERSSRDTMLTIKDTLYRGNVVYTGISGGIGIHKYLATRNELGEDAGNWRKSDASGNEYSVVGAPRRQKWSGTSVSAPSEPDAEARARIEAHKWDPPRFEIALNLGYSNYRTHENEGVLIGLFSSNPSNCDYFLAMGDDVNDGWAAGVSLTVNSWKWVSNEFTYMRQQTKFLLVGIDETNTCMGPTPPQPSLNGPPVGWATRRFAYNTVLNLRPPRSRWRPYITVGPAVQLLALADTPLKSSSEYFRLGLSNIGLIQAGIDFGNTPPLNGGGIYQIALQYGAGFKYRALPRLTIRADYGETWSANPQVIKKSYKGYLPTALDNTYTTIVTDVSSPAKYIQQRSTVGFAFTF